MLVLIGSGLRCWSQGIPEPSLVLYGAITDSSSGARLSYGPLVWVFQPGDGSATVTISGVLTNINDQFSYVVRIPCETILSGMAVSPDTLKLGTTYDRSQVTISGVQAFFAQPSLTNLVLASTDRGRIEQIDLTVNLNTGMLLPDAWQIQYFGHTGVDPLADPDHDGMNNWEEYVAGTNPTDPQSRFAVIKVTPDSTGVTVEWSAVLGKTYSLERSDDLINGFTTIVSGVAGAEPTTVYRDTNATGTGPYFYRVKVE